MDPNVNCLEDFSTAVVSGGVSATLLSLVFMADFHHIHFSGHSCSPETDLYPSHKTNRP